MEHLDTKRDAGKGVKEEDEKSGAQANEITHGKHRLRHTFQCKTWIIDSGNCSPSSPLLEWQWCANGITFCSSYSSPSFGIVPCRRSCQMIFSPFVRLKRCFKPSYSSFLSPPDVPVVSFHGLMHLQEMDGYELNGNCYFGKRKKKEMPASLQGMESFHQSRCVSPE